MYEADRRLPMVDISQFMSESDRKLLAVIEKVRLKGGEPYAGSTENARRNPVKPDTYSNLIIATMGHGSRHIVEYGTAYLLSACLLSQGAPTARIDTFENDLAVAAEAQGYADETGRDITVHGGDVADFDFSTLAGADTLFVDHDKKSYLAHFLLIEKFLAPGALKMFDNVIDRFEECKDLVGYMFQNYPSTQIIQTQAGLLVATT